MNTYETARDLLAAADVANQRFHACLRQEMVIQFENRYRIHFVVAPVWRRHL
ncbi:hypothetical protein KIN20_032767 [Parelaphostrongylus tenuis]|uniref:Uncharacterized protein n=1 Tax=Parelaphostrongylus tenuis TaxID=148309 RepID=A0AAD5WHQ9_PARTN|nr:hypothetical protein KIN20_032767 [Parelaphostrongylus tenuis]